MVKHVDDVPDVPRRFLNFRRKKFATHRGRLHTVPDERLRVEEPLEQDLPGCHYHLRQLVQNPGRLDELTT